MRFEFGGVADFIVTLGTGNVATLKPSATLKFYDAEDGQQVTDLTTLLGDPIPDGILTSDATGAVPPFLGPEGAYRLWVSADGGPRRAMSPTNVGAFAEIAQNAAAAIAQHLAAGNPHQIPLSSLTDVDTTTTPPAAGQALIWSGDVSRWIPATLPQLTNVWTTDGDQVISGVQKTLTITDTGKSAMILQAAPGQVADVFVCRSPTGQRGLYANEDGEGRARSTAPNQVAFRVSGEVGQTADLQQWATSAGVPLAWLDAAGRMRAPNINAVPPFAVKGAVTPGTGTIPYWNDTGQALTLRSVRVSARNVTTDLVIDFNVNGTSVFTAANRPTIPAGQTTSGAVTAISTTTIPAGATMTVDIDAGAAEDMIVQPMVY
ncbi:hypothetical protein [Thermomonospora amylolytica]|uniref:hypothetical protein n=1 Tax=Thermomonospora amylolytica TaxID=1411117 RepID=UPI000E6B9EE6|nr:hypothetical protein [Thermomonospora amylolytica]